MFTTLIKQYLILNNKNSLHPPCLFAQGKTYHYSHPTQIFSTNFGKRFC